MLLPDLQLSLHPDLTDRSTNMCPKYSAAISCWLNPDISLCVSYRTYSVYILSPTPFTVSPLLCCRQRADTDSRRAERGGMLHGMAIAPIELLQLLLVLLLPLTDKGKSEQRKATLPQKYIFLPHFLLNMTMEIFPLMSSHFLTSQTR